MASPQPYPEGVQLRGIVTPHEHDVLSGRGNFVNYHAGNEHFRTLVKKHKIAYVACPKPEKGKFSKIIVDEIRSMDPPGRFLKQDPTTKLWEDIGDKKSLDKTRQALREGAPELMKELTGEDESGDIEQYESRRNVPQSTSQAESAQSAAGQTYHGQLAQIQRMSHHSRSAQLKPTPTLSSRRDSPSVAQVHGGHVPSSQFAAGSEGADVHHSNQFCAADQLRMAQLGQQPPPSSFPAQGHQDTGGFRRDQTMPLSTQAQIQTLLSQIPMEALEPTPINPYAQSQVQTPAAGHLISVHGRGHGGTITNSGVMHATHQVSSKGGATGAAASHLVSVRTGSIPGAAAAAAAAMQRQPDGITSLPMSAQGRRNSLKLEDIMQGAAAANVKPSSSKTTKNMAASSTNMSFSVGDIDSNLSSAFDDSLVISLEGEEGGNKSKGGSGPIVKTSKTPPAIKEEPPVRTVALEGTESGILKGMTNSEAAMSFSMSDAADLLGSTAMQMSYRFDDGGEDNKKS